MLDDILRLPNGARFYRADLHNHTPRDSAFHCGTLAVDTEEQKQAFARAYVRFARMDQNLDIIGVTEHNDVLWLPYIQTAAAELNAELEQLGKSERLIVMPGVELSATGGRRGIHFLVLFEPGTNKDNIDHWLSSIGLVSGERFHGDDTPRLVQKMPVELLKLCFGPNDTLRRIPIAAHAFSENGLLSGNDVAGEQRATAYNSNYLLAVEIPERPELLSPWGRQVVNGELETYGHKPIACLNGSDGRGLNKVNEGRLPIGTRNTRIKFSKISVEGLRQAFIDFESRIRLGADVAEVAYPQIMGVEFEGGFLGGPPDPANPDAPRSPFRLHLNPNLNTVIGGRGVGKSALVEAIRYAFDLEAKSRDTQGQTERLLDSTFKPGAKVTVYYQLPDGASYRIERIRPQFKERDALKQFTHYEQPPKVYDAQTGEEKIGALPKDIWPGANPIEVYSQKEIYEISNNPKAQLSLLDNYLSESLKPLLAQESELKRELEKNADDILRLREDVDDAGQRLQELPGIRLEIDRLKERDALKQFNRREQHQREERLLSAVESDVERLKADLQSFLTEHPPLAEDRLGEHLRGGLPHVDLLTRQAALLAEIDQQLSQRIESLIGEIDAIWAKGADDRAQWKAGYDKVLEEYYTLMREFADASAERLTELTRRKETLEAIQQEVDKRRQRIAELENTRRGKLQALRVLRRDRIYPLRRDKAAELTGRLGGALQVSVALEGQRDSYQEFLSRMFTGARIQSSVVGLLAEAKDGDTYLDPIDLVEAIRKEKDNLTEADSPLAQTYKISEAYRKRLAALSDDMLRQIEIFNVPDRIDIRLRVGAQYRSLFPPPGEFGLSTGQRCTAILSLILVERNTPLIVDQPEDDLDNQFIFDEIVQTLRREKERRQFLIATHNANIPVSGDAELIIVLAANEKGGWVEKTGSIDDPALREPVENILEGGPDAFLIRKEKYGLPD